MCCGKIDAAREKDTEREKDMFLKEIKQKARLKKWGERES